MKILISGFEKFDGHLINPTEELMKRLKSPSKDIELKTVVLPVSFKQAFEKLEREINSFKPDVIIGTGLAASRKEITFERIAVNLIEARIPDNDGHQPIDEKIDPQSEDGVFTQLPLKSMLKATLDKGFKASISNTAGTYVCNYLMYKIVSYCKQNHLKGGFIHVPPVYEMNSDSRYIKIDQLVEAFIQILLALKYPEDVSINTGLED
ncbi:MAG: pyroglutamyl-peptidase I [Bdellovibrio sp.]